ncbi:MAG: hypothetical protein WCF33_01705 [Pseudonocardiaceae bacterium]
MVAQEDRLPSGRQGIPPPGVLARSAVLRWLWQRQPGVLSPVRRCCGNRRLAAGAELAKRSPLEDRGEVVVDVCGRPQRLGNRVHHLGPHPSPVLGMHVRRRVTIGELIDYLTVVTDLETVLKRQLLGVDDGMLNGRDGVRGLADSLGDDAHSGRHCVQPAHQ